MKVVNATSKGQVTTRVEVRNGHGIAEDTSLVEATSFAVMERFGLKRALAFDRHVEQFGLRLVRD